ncbi:Flp pilus assembly complex ATPase component TadA [Burkholderia sp. 9775_39]|uniref:ATPase, T2SS/T4P/T4SS family n=1 Tax=unclassified Burkholderia TaxID=2613784 RepID=UPI0018C3856F|nr:MULTISPECIES: ATPase, T2SS/T4P/T4SS family [unclassified Burkholderia]MBG0880356.1 Flp pilus assembly complex ATPase component TadA [Burkholderia sp. 9775_39]MBG0886181.1 Flp pilus assembly complex ATPase component TadA [Burkholderia sp. 9773_38]
MTSIPSRDFGIQTLADAVEQGANILITGIASSGKSSLLCALAAYVPHTERMVVLDDARTVAVLGGDPSTIRPVPVDGGCCFVQWAIDTYPDRLIVDDLRDTEASWFVRAHSAGRTGGMASMCGTSARGALARVEVLMVSATGYTDTTSPLDIRHAISRCFSYVIHIQRENGRRYVSEVLAVKGFKDGDYVLERVF